MTRGNQILLVLIVLTLIVLSLLTLFPVTSKKVAGTQSKLPVQTENWLTETIPQGGSIYSVLEKQGIPLREIAILTYHFGNYIDVTTIQPGDTLKILLAPNQTSIAKLMFIQEPTSRHHFTVLNDSLAYTLQQLPVVTRFQLLKGSLEGTLDSSLLALGLDPADKQQINNGLEADINFPRDAKKGDRFQIYLQERIFEGRRLPGSKILYVCYEGEQTGKHELFRYEDSTEKSVLTGLYTVEGKSNGGSGVGFPLASIHVVSPFGNRIDPIYGRWAHHQGIDYRARMGTPVYAVANGTVTSASYSGGWGNEVRIKHASGLLSQYAHLSSMSVSRSQKVVRGQVIGRVGSTGRSTGAHLHFGLISGNSYLNPTQLKMVGAEKLDAEHMKLFKAQMEQLRAQMKEFERSNASKA